MKQHTRLSNQIQGWREDKVLRPGMSRGQTMVEAAQNHVGLEAGEAERFGYGYL